MHADTTTPDTMTLNQAINLLRQPGVYYPTVFGTGTKEIESVEYHQLILPLLELVKKHEQTINNLETIIQKHEQIINNL